MKSSHQGAQCLALYELAATRDIHRAPFTRLLDSDLSAREGAVIVPGEIRHREVSMGRLVAPAASAVEPLRARWPAVDAGVRRSETALVAMAASHQRLGWGHPFLDGNGRVTRLHTHCLPSALRYSGGVWSPLRGLARSADRCCALLAAADKPRRGDLDGRSNLNEAALVDGIDFALEICLEQVSFMRAMLNLGTIEQRIAACLSFEQETLKSVGIFGRRGRVLRFLSGAPSRLIVADPGAAL